MKNPNLEEEQRFYLAQLYLRADLWVIPARFQLQGQLELLLVLLLRPVLPLALRLHRTTNMQGYILFITIITQYQYFVRNPALNFLELIT